MEKFKILTGENLSEKIYLKTWNLDNEIFEDKDKLTKQQALDWFYGSNKSTIVLWNEEDNELVGYLTAYLMNDSFFNKYIITDLNYKDAINNAAFCKVRKNTNANLYIFSTVIKKEYRDIIIEKKDKNSVFYKKTAFKVLNEALVDWICKILKAGVTINYIFGDKVSKDGEKYLKSLKMKEVLVTKDDSKFASKFSSSCFEKCSNARQIDEMMIEKSSILDQSILHNHEYLSFKDNILHYCNINLLDLINNYQAPLEVAYTPMITKQIKYLKNLFKDKINKYGYEGKYNYAYATKANYFSEVVLTALKDVDMLETSSAYDINIIVKLVKQGIIKSGYTVLCNGFKNEKYIESLKILLKKGINVIPIIENENEFEMLKKLKHYKMNVGLRYNSDFEARIIKNNFVDNEEFDNRFGFNETDIFRLAEEINKTTNISLKVLHFHFGGTISNIDNFIKGYTNILHLYCQLKKKYDSLEYFDFGGGLPVKYSLDFDFDYDYLVDEIIKSSQKITNKNRVKAPNLIGEHGRFTVADHSFYIYKIDFAKHANNKNWYIINGSLMNMTPDMWGINQDFTILPVNLLQNETLPVCLGGETCDPDDRYFLQEVNKTLYLPKINENETLYIAIFSIGAYQEIISGIDGVHHCLIPEGNELIIYEDKNNLKFFKANDIQSPEEILDKLDYNNTKYIKKFIK